MIYPPSPSFTLKVTCTAAPLLASPVIALVLCIIHYFIRKKKEKKMTTDCQDRDQGKPNCTMMRNKQKEGKTVVVKEKKTMRNSTVLVEGSRCSRVNGRGWRCCQPTLVGYLLCEHHLGKGRMRNMSYNASRGQLGCTENKRNLSESGSVDIAVRKKRNIVPPMKARSISSLFDDEDGAH